MMNEKDKNSGGYHPVRQFLEVGQPYSVQCKNIRCMAVVDKEGKWINCNNGRELQDVINVFSVGARTSTKLQTWLVIPANKNSILESANANSL
jgi:hypothetical protein